MKNKSKRTLTPKLRFPEFRGKPGWEEKSINSISDVNPSNDGLPDSFVYIDLESVEQGKLVAQKVINREGAPSRAQRLLRKRDVIYQTVRPYQRNNLFFDVEDELDYVASTGYAQLRAHASPAFLFQLLHTDDFVNRVLAKCTGSNYPAINSSDLAAIEVTVPSPDEQQKIAECLSSLDGLIAAEGRKLAALRDHKRGLMQQLFPQPGQTQPRLRFPEFRGKGEWKSVKLLTILEEYREKSTVQDQYEVLTSARRGLIRQKDYYGEGRITDRDNVGFNIIPQNYITYRSRADDRRFYFNENDLGVTGIISTYYPVFRLVEGSNKFFIELLAHYRETIGMYSVGTSQTVLSLPMLGKIKLPIPTPAEQQRIADCLTSLDAQITAQAAKIDALKTHKRGLMQQLFPAPEANES